MGDGVVAGEELPFFGHIGNRKNCDGCHRNTRDEMVYASSGSIQPGDATIIPEISWISESVAVVGSQGRLQIVGSGFVEKADGTPTTYPLPTWKPPCPLICRQEATP